MIIAYTFLVMLAGFLEAELIMKKRYAWAIGIAFTVIVGSIFLQATANYILSHRIGFAGGYYNRF